jgi:MoaA/NifB/PqqE/SkfB family radical SAM enzyme
VLVSERADEIGDAALVSVSLDGPKEIQDAVRGLSYDKIIAGLEAMAARGIDFSLFAVVGKHNIDALGDVIDLAEHYRTAAFFQPMRIQKEDTLQKSTAYFPEGRRMREAMDYLVEEKKRGRPVASSYEYLEAIGRCWPDRMPEVRCFGGKLFCFVTPEGFVTQCCDTLATASETPECDLTSYGAAAVRSIPPCECTTCYSSLPLEANILFTAARRNPLWAAGRVLSGLLPPKRTGS